MTSKLRIYTIITTFFPDVGGAETQTLAQCQRLQKLGHETQVVTFCHSKDWPKHENIQGIPTLRVGRLLLGRRRHWQPILRRFLYFFAIILLCWTIWHHRKNFDILQVCQCSVLVLPLSLLCLLLKKPMTIVVISSGAEKPTKTNEAATLLAGPLDPNAPWLRIDGRTWIDGDLYGLQRAGKLVVQGTRLLLKHAGAVMIVLSTRMSRYLQTNGFDLPGTELIPNGVDIQRFQPENLNTIDTASEHTVTCVSKLRYEKGIDVLLQAWRIVQAQEPTARLVIVGDGPIHKQLERLAQELQIAQSVEFTGLKSDVPQQLQRGLINILPSRWEGMPNALLEAMASGRACIATHVSGSEDLIEPGINGLLVESEQYEHMAQAILTLLHNPTLARRYGQAARHKVEQEYTLEYVTNRYIEVYRRITKTRDVLPETITTREKLLSGPLV